MMAQRGKEPKRPWIVGHRGASAYAPENTIPALLLAAEQGATYVEYDLQPTKDGVLVLLHDETLERTTDVEEVFPQRFREVKGADGATVKRWYFERLHLRRSPEARRGHMVRREVQRARACRATSKRSTR